MKRWIVVSEYAELDEFDSRAEAEELRLDLSKKYSEDFYVAEIKEPE